MTSPDVFCDLLFFSLMNQVTRFLPRWQLDGIKGAVVVIDVIRAFTSAAYAFGAGAEAIYLVGTVDEALSFIHRHPEALAMGEDRGHRIPGFAFSNSPVEVSRANLSGRTLVQRTSAGTQGVIAATHATRLWCASLACATATARAVDRAGVGPPTYVITGQRVDQPGVFGDEDLACAEYIEQIRTAQIVDAASTIHRIANSNDAQRTLLLGPDHVDPQDIAFATRIDAFDFAMEAMRTPRGLCVRAVRP